MKKYCGGGNFQSLYNHFITRDFKGKIFVMEDYHTESLQIGAGATLLIEKAESFLLEVLKEWYQKKPCVLIGDIPLLFQTVKKRRTACIKHTIQKGRQKFERVPILILQLHNILREQGKSTKKKKGVINMK